MTPEMTLAALLSDRQARKVKLATGILPNVPSPSVQGMPKMPRIGTSVSRPGTLPGTVPAPSVPGPVKLGMVLADRWGRELAHREFEKQAFLGPALRAVARTTLPSLAKSRVGVAGIGAGLGAAGGVVRHMTSNDPQSSLVGNVVGGAAIGAGAGLAAKAGSTALLRSKGQWGQQARAALKDANTKAGGGMKGYLERGGGPKPKVAPAAAPPPAAGVAPAPPPAAKPPNTLPPVNQPPAAASVGPGGVPAASAPAPTPPAVSPTMTPDGRPIRHVGTVTDASALPRRSVGTRTRAESAPASPSAKARYAEEKARRPAAPASGGAQPPWSTKNPAVGQPPVKPTSMMEPQDAITIGGQHHENAPVIQQPAARVLDAENAVRRNSAGVVPPVVHGGSAPQPTSPGRVPYRRPPAIFQGVPTAGPALTTHPAPGGYRAPRAVVPMQSIQ